MPSQFRFFGLNSTSDNPHNNNGTSSNGAPAASFVHNAGSHAPAHGIEPAGSAPDPSDDNDIGAGLHEVIKSTDFWFNYQLSLLEKFAVSEAEEWAKAGIPRQDAPVVGELPIESSLKARGAEIFQEWIARIKRKVQDSIQAAYADAGDKIVQFRHVFAQLERNKIETETTESAIRDREEALRNQQKTFGTPALLHKGIYLAMLALLTGIDWIANVPIFSELLPAEAGSHQIWRQLAIAAEKSGAMGGIRMVLQRLIFHPDVTIFAFGVVIFLMAMAHFEGESIRRWIVFNPEDEPLLAPTLRAHRRQTLMPICAAFLGILLAISFLYLSRSRLIEATAIGLDRAQHDMEEADGKLAAARSTQGDLNKVPELQQRANLVKSNLDDWRERDRFAKDIGMMNTPILLLNIVLALTAITAAYCAAKPTVVEGKLVDPLIPELKSKLSSLRLEVVNQRQSLRALDSSIETSISRTKYLAGTRPLAEWEAKAQRLNAVVTLFRAENARARGVDPESIIAFKQRSAIDFPSVPNEAFQVPPELTALEEEFRELRNSQPHAAGAAA
ncbi:MAG TPA: hypothetical protein VKZ53_18785 [Candidatus Angelobacter sp.]|nr:hypothetical protein [Candidatus Angelobacter sp.]